MSLRHRFTASSLLALSLLGCGNAPAEPSATSSQTIVDSTNAAPAGSALVPALPVRLIDRSMPGSTFAPGESRAVQVAGRGGFPPGVTAIAVSLTVTLPRAAGFFSASSPDLGYPIISFNQNQQVSNFAILPVGADGNVVLTNHSAGVVSVQVDVEGAFAPDHPFANGLRSVRNRVLLSAQTATLAGLETRRFPITAADGPYAGQNYSAAFIELMAQNSQDGELTVQPMGSGLKPIALQLTHRETRTGTALVTLTDGAFSITNTSASEVSLDVTLTALASPTNAATSGRFVPVSPQQLFKGKLPASGETTGYTLPPPLPTAYKTMVMTQVTTSNVAGATLPFSCIAIVSPQYVNANDFANSDLITSFYPGEARTTGGLVSEDKRIHDQISASGCTGDLQAVSWGYFTP